MSKNPFESPQNLAESRQLNQRPEESPEVIREDESVLFNEPETFATTYENGLRAVVTNVEAEWNALQHYAPAVALRDSEALLGHLGSTVRTMEDDEVGSAMEQQSRHIKTEEALQETVPGIQESRIAIERLLGYLSWELQHQQAIRDSFEQHVSSEHADDQKYEDALTSTRRAYERFDRQLNVLHDSLKEYIGTENE